MSPNMSSTTGWYSVVFIVELLLVKISIATYGTPSLFGKFIIKLNYIKNCDHTIGSHIYIHYEDSKNVKKIQCDADSRLSRDEIKGTHGLYIWESGDWKQMGSDKYNHENGLDTNPFIPSSFTQFIKTIINCPVEKVNSILSYENLLHSTPNTTQELMYGRFKSELNITRGVEPWGCIESVFDVLPSNAM